MGVIFTLTPAVKSVVTQALDDLITELGKNCRLYYPPKWVNCDNCVYDSIGQKSSNRWRSGGPVQFSVGSACPLCDGKGKKAQEVTEDILLLCQFDPKNFIRPVQGVDVRQPYSLLQTKGYLADLPKIQRCDHLVFQTDAEAIVRLKFRLKGEPGDRSNIIQGRYFVAIWERWNG